MDELPTIRWIRISDVQAVAYLTAPTGEKLVAKMVYLHYPASTWLWTGYCGRDCWPPVGGGAAPTAAAAGRQIHEWLGKMVFRIDDPQGPAVTKLIQREMTRAEDELDTGKFGATPFKASQEIQLVCDLCGLLADSRCHPLLSPALWSIRELLPHLLEHLRDSHDKVGFKCGSFAPPMRYDPGTRHFGSARIVWV